MLDPMTEPSARRPLSTAAIVALALLGAATLFCVGSAAMLYSSRPVASSTTEVLRATPDVITAIRDLARLEATTFHIERVIDLRDDQRHLFGLVGGQDSILLVAAGDVVAGVDLSKLGPEDVSVDPARGTARIVLPAPEVLTAALDEDGTYVFSRETDVFARRDQELETRARREAARSIRAAAIEAGILDRAGQSAKQTVASLVRALGYVDVDVRLATDER